MSEKPKTTSESHGSIADRPSTVPWPPIVYGVAIIVGFLLHWQYRLPWISGFGGEFAFMAGLILIAGALFIDVRTFLELKIHKTTVLPTKGASALVTSGPFSFSRNPIYLSNTILTFGLAMAFGAAWLILLGLMAAVITNELAIKPEERHLAIKFGTRWRDYKKKVRRWI
jgi:protein-S-isoprenylcysteine O-methyltransferase Ste14